MDIICKKCKYEIKEDSIYCPRCGMKLNDLSKNLEEKIKYTGYIPLWKFALFSFLSFELYNLYWMYKAWKILRDDYNINVSPFWRTFFSPFFVGSLAKNSFEFAEKKGYPKNDSFFIIGVCYFFLNLLDNGFTRVNLSGKIPYPYSLISFVFTFFTMILLVPIVKSMNYYWFQEHPKLSEKKLSWWQIALIIISIVIIILNLIP